MKKSKFWKKKLKIENLKKKIWNWKFEKIEKVIKVENLKNLKKIKKIENLKLKNWKIWKNLWFSYIVYKKCIKNNKSLEIPNISAILVLLVLNLRIINDAKGVLHDNQWWMK